MTTAYSTLLGLALPVQGELSGTWGDTVDNGITRYLDIAVAGTVTLTGDGAVTMSLTNGDSSATNIVSSLTGAGTVSAQFAIIRVTGTLTVAKVLTPPSSSRTYVVVNAATGSTVTVKASGQTGVSIAVGETAFVYFNGTDYVKLVGTATAGAAGGSTTQVQYNSSGVLAGSANMTFDGTTLTAAGFSGPHNGTVGATTATTGAFTTLAASSTVTLSGGTANGVTYLNGSKVLTSGPALTFDGTNFGTTGIASIGAGARIQGSGSLSGTGVGAEIFATGGVTYYSSYDRTGNAYAPLNLFSGTYTAFSVGSEQMRLTSTGLGIGTSSPTEKLHVAGAIRATGAVTANAIGGILAYQGSSTVMLGSWGADASTYGAIQFYQANSTGTINRTGMLLDSAGNLGLGVTPSAWTSYKALQLSGSAYIYGFGNDELGLGQGAYYSSGWKYAATGVPATWYSTYRGSYIWQTAPAGTAGDAITFTQAMTLDASGHLLVGKTSQSATTVGFEVTPAGVVRSTLAGSTNATDTLDVYSTGAGAYRFYVSMDGKVNATSTTISAISDQRLKENVRDIDTGLNAVLALKPRRFDWKEGKGQDKKNVAGFIAQEFETVFPECVGTAKAGEDGIEYKNINHETLIPTLVKAIQEQQALIESLTTRLAALEAA